MVGFHVFLIKGLTVVLPDFLPRRGWTIHNKGYLIYTSRSKTSGIKRGARAHRLVVEKLLGRPLLTDEHVHHQDHNKLRCCPCNLIMMPWNMNPSGAQRDPYTGEFMSIDEYKKRYHTAIKIDMPDWVAAA